MIKYGKIYEYIVYEESLHQWKYKIYLSEYNNVPVVISREWFDSEGESRLAAIGHITILENGEQ